MSEKMEDDGDHYDQCGTKANHSGFRVPPAPRVTVALSHVPCTVTGISWDVTLDIIDVSRYDSTLFFNFTFTCQDAPRHRNPTSSAQQLLSAAAPLFSYLYLKSSTHECTVCLLRVKCYHLRVHLRTRLYGILRSNSNGVYKS